MTYAIETPFAEDGFLSQEGVFVAANNSFTEAPTNIVWDTAGMSHLIVQCYWEGTIGPSDTCNLNVFWSNAEQMQDTWFIEPTKLEGDASLYSSNAILFSKDHPYGKFFATFANPPRYFMMSLASNFTGTSLVRVNVYGARR